MNKIKALLILGVLGALLMNPTKAKEPSTEVVIQRELPLKQTVRLIMELEGVPENDIQTFFRIIHCESKWNPDAHRTSTGSETTGDFGLFQINYIHGLATSTMYDPIQSTHFAITLYKKNGFRDWTCY